MKQSSAYGSTAASTSLAYFISPHGYGHAARATAVMAAIQTLDPDIHFEIFTKVPLWFFEESLTGSFNYHPLLTDIGLVQKDSLVEDLAATIDCLNDFLPFRQPQLKDLASQIKALKPACQLILCDIAPLGIAVAHQAGIPAILVENFTWDWIYRGYQGYETKMAPYIDYLQELFKSADYHIQTEPVCLSGKVDLTTKPVSRKFKATPAQTRARLGVPSRARLIVMSMGGMAWDYSFLETLEAMEDIYFVVAGNSQPLKPSQNLILLGRDSGIFHPDLLNSCDAIIGKVGYSTVAEVYQVGIPFGYIGRPAFRESPPLIDYVESKMAGIPFSGADLQDGTWLTKLPSLLALPRTQNDKLNGADQVAEFIFGLIS